MEKLREVFTLTRRHATNLGCFVFGYKAVLSLLRYLQQRHRQWHPLVSAALVGYFVLGAENGVNTQVCPIRTLCVDPHPLQINLYLLSRVLYALAKLSAEKGHITPSGFEHRHFTPYTATVTSNSL
jgi:peroxisomal membrane protein 4